MFGPHPAKAELEARTGRRVVRFSGLSGGCVGDVSLAEMDDGSRYVAKVGDAGSGLEIEGWMLSHLAEHSDLPVPGVLYADDTLLLMDYVPSGGRVTAQGERHAADLLVSLHGIKGEVFGLERDTLIGGLHQPNPKTATWVDFFRDQRLLFMAGEAERAGRLPSSLMRRIETLAGRLSEWIDEPAHPSLIHGDIWSGNVLGDGDRIAAFIDPALYYADPEIELAFITLFSTFGDAFFRHYDERVGIRPGFFEIRRDLYNLYPLLVHVRLFGGSYVSSVERTLSRFGV